MHLSMCLCVFVCVCMCVCVCVHMYVCMCACTFACIYVCVYVYVAICVYDNKYVRKYTVHINFWYYHCYKSQQSALHFCMLTWVRKLHKYCMAYSFVYTFIKFYSSIFLTLIHQALYWLIFCMETIAYVGVQAM